MSLTADGVATKRNSFTNAAARSGKHLQDKGRDDASLSAARDDINIEPNAVHHFLPLLVAVCFKAVSSLCG